MSRCVSGVGTTAAKQAARPRRPAAQRQDISTLCATAALRLRARCARSLGHASRSPQRISLRSIARSSSGHSPITSSTCPWRAARPALPSRSRGRSVGGPRSTHQYDHRDVVGRRPARERASSRAIEVAAFAPAAVRWRHRVVSLRTDGLAMVAHGREVPTIIGCSRQRRNLEASKVRRGSDFWSRA